MITFVEGDDWRGIYVDGKLYVEGHSWPMIDTVAAIKKAGGKAEIVYADLTWLASEGSLPDDLSSVVW